MEKVDYCLCCSSRSLRAYPALIAPFIKKYVLPDEEWACKFLECNDCGFRFFDKRYSEKELSVLYHNYRQEAYFAARHSVEPWYTQQVNENIGAGADELVFRHASILEFMHPIDPAAITDVLDYGGDSGQFIPKPLGKNKYLYDISHVPAIAGVTSLNDEQELCSRQFDFIMCCSVIEHVPTPAGILAQIKPLLRDKNSWLYLEIPFENWKSWAVPGSTLYAAYLNSLTRSENVLKLVDYYSTGFRVKCKFIPPLGFIKMHEHINFFTEKSVEALLSSNGFSLQKLSLIEHSPIAGIKATQIYALAKLA